MLKTSEAADALGVSRKTILRMIARGVFPGARKLGGPGPGRREWRIPNSDLDNYLGGKQ